VSCKQDISLVRVLTTVFTSWN